MYENPIITHVLLDLPYQLLSLFTPYNIIICYDIIICYYMPMIYTQPLLNVLNRNHCLIDVYITLLAKFTLISIDNISQWTD